MSQYPARVRQPAKTNANQVNAPAGGPLYPQLSSPNAVNVTVGRVPHWSAMTYHQPELFPLVEPGYYTVIISTQQLSEKRWLAMIASGWWQAYGRTKDEAIKKVIRAYEDGA